MRYNSGVGESFDLEVPPTLAGTRLDVFLSEAMAEPSRTFIQRLIKDDLVSISPGKVKPGYRLKGAEKITLFLPELVEMSAEPEYIPLSVLYEDEHIIVIDKQPGIVAHPSPGHETGTLVNALLFHCKNLSGIGGVLRPGIVHRLDRDTSGCMVAAKTDFAHRELCAQFAGRSTEKHYLALTDGIPRADEGTVEGQIGRSVSDRKKQALLPDGGRYSLTHYRVLEKFAAHALVECILKTGRTHQARVHLKSLQTPVLADADYSKHAAFFDKTSGETLLSRQALHAWKLSFNHPVSGVRLELVAELPADMARVLEYLRAGN